MPRRGAQPATLRRGVYYFTRRRATMADTKEQGPKKNWCPECETRRRTAPPADGVHCMTCGAVLEIEPPYDEDD